MRRVGTPGKFYLSPFSFFSLPCSISWLSHLFCNPIIISNRFGRAQVKQFLQSFQTEFQNLQVIMFWSESSSAEIEFSRLKEALLSSLEIYSSYLESGLFFESTKNRIRVNLTGSDFLTKKDLFVLTYFAGIAMQNKAFWLRPGLQKITHYGKKILNTQSPNLYLVWQ